MNIGPAELGASYFPDLGFLKYNNEIDFLSAKLSLLIIVIKMWQTNYSNVITNKQRHNKAYVTILKVIN